MPKIFNTIDAEMKACFGGKRTEEVVPALPPGTIEFMDSSVTSVPIMVPGHRFGCILRGRFDTVIRFDDGGFAVVDFKTAARNDEHIPMYSRQLHAYAIALEQPALNALCLRPIRRLGLLVFEPAAFANGVNQCDLHGALQWVEIEVCRERFLHFLGDVFEVLDISQAPGAGKGCGWCQYRHTSRVSGF